jgi:transcriptional regulator with XRE-family HTH domain
MAIRKPRKTETPFASPVGAKIQDVRVKKGLTQQELAEKIGVSLRKITYYERFAKNPSIQFIEQAAEALGVKPDTLIDPKKEPKFEAVPSVIKSLKQRIPKLSELSRQDQEALVSVIDGLLSK